MIFFLGWAVLLKNPLFPLKSKNRFSKNNFFQKTITSPKNTQKMKIYMQKMGYIGSGDQKLEETHFSLVSLRPYAYKGPTKP